MNSRYERPKLVIGLLGIDYINERQMSPPVYLDYYSDRQKITSIGGYDKLVHFSGISQQETVTTELRENVACAIHSDALNLTMDIMCGGGITDSLRIDFRPMMKRLSDTYGNISFQANIPPETMTVEEQNDHLKVKVVVHHLRHHQDNNAANTNSSEADVFIGLRQR